VRSFALLLVHFHANLSTCWRAVRPLEKGAWVCGLLAFLINHQPRGEPAAKLISTHGDNLLLLLLHPHWFHLKPFCVREQSLRKSEWDIIL
jgi:hypothetical protein